MYVTTCNPYSSVLTKFVYPRLFIPLIIRDYPIRIRIRIYLLPYTQSDSNSSKTPMQETQELQSIRSISYSQEPPPKTQPSYSNPVSA